MTALIPYLFAFAALLSLASLAGDARRFVTAMRDLARYIEED